jgi:hypothetical protein
LPILKQCIFKRLTRESTKEINLISLIAEFRECQDFKRLEKLADRIGNAGNKEVIEQLLYRLGDDHVQDDPDVEDAVCTALVKLGVMRTMGNLNFRFLEKSLLPSGVLELLEEYISLIPRRYFRE